MFDIGFLELVIVSVVGLLVLGPDKLPGAIRTASLWIGKLKRSFNNIRSEVERELRADEIRQDLHNQSIMQQLKNTEKELREGLGFDSPAADKYGIPPGLDMGTEEPAKASGMASGAAPVPSEDMTDKAAGVGEAAEKAPPNTDSQSRTEQSPPGDSTPPESAAGDTGESRQP